MKEQSRGVLVALEGIDGSGKSTLAATLHRRFMVDGIPALATREPGGSLLGKALRELLQHRQSTINPQAEFLLFAADRSQHMQEVVFPALNQGILVISDRLADSSLVYQGYGKGVDQKMIQSINSWVMSNREPDLICYLAIDQQTANERITARGKKLTAFEKESAVFIQRLIDGFENLYADKKCYPS